MRLKFDFQIPENVIRKIMERHDLLVLKKEKGYWREHKWIEETSSHVVIDGVPCTIQEAFLKLYQYEMTSALNAAIVKIIQYPKPEKLTANSQQPKPINT